jgi:hypothetical protein
VYCSTAPFLPLSAAVRLIMPLILSYRLHRCVLMTFGSSGAGERLDRWLPGWVLGPNTLAPARRPLVWLCVWACRRRLDEAGLGFGWWRHRGGDTGPVLLVRRPHAQYMKRCRTNQ